MSRDSGAEQPTQRTVAELLAEYGGSSQRNTRRRRRRAEDPSETAPQAIIDRVLSDSGKLRPVQPDEEPPQRRGHRQGPQGSGAPQPPAAPEQPTTQVPVPADAQQPEPPAAPEPQRDAAEAPEQPGTNYWAQRFASASPPAQSASPQAKLTTPTDDPEATVRQPALPQAEPRRGDGETEQLPRVRPQAGPPASEEGTEVLPYPQTAPAEADEQGEPADPYDVEPYSAEDDYGEDDYGEDEYGGDEYADDYGEDDFAAADDYDPELPAGLDDEDYADDEAAERSPGREWGILAVQGVVGLLAGGLVWFGFRYLWMFNSIAALIAALVVTGALVLVARKVLRTDDLQTILLAVLVGLACTVSPVALMMLSR
ncbi:hypothetical protein [Saccharopolyspora rosea]|uniref:hypothetical protein n=1 Tax=Saccharopolyspora rosea TaxID=524884 RepID=UPI0021D90CD3|nr:hypothetical protein [Saccharopolyspora rosea]